MALNIELNWVYIHKELYTTAVGKPSTTAQSREPIAIVVLVANK